MDLRHYGQVSGEYTLCGDAFDLSKLDDSEAETPVFAKPGEIVTCPKCRAHIDDIKNNITRSYRVKLIKQGTQLVGQQAQKEPGKDGRG